jgi:acrylyl-CoA reductase (NADPH)
MDMEPASFKALRVTEVAPGNFEKNIESCNFDILPEGEVLIKVLFSSLNYKDALSASGNKGVSRKYPHTPGIDAAGIVEHSLSPSFKPGDEVIVTGYDLGMNTPGGFGGYIRVPAEWVVTKPENLTLRESMIFGTAGFTAALALRRLQRNGQQPESGPVLVTGATGGVGSFAVALLAKSGYEVIASTGKNEEKANLKKLGAETIIGRGDLNDTTGRALLRGRWAGAIDTVGGNTLATVIKSCMAHGSVACCGNVSSAELNTTVFPFILNGVSLLGVNSATCLMPERKEIWKLLADKWKVRLPECYITVSSLSEMPHWIDIILRGNLHGRVVLDHSL